MLRALHAAWYISTVATESSQMLPALVSSAAMIMENSTETICTVVALLSAFWA